MEPGPETGSLIQCRVQFSQRRLPGTVHSQFLCLQQSAWGRSLIHGEQVAKPLGGVFRIGPCQELEDQSRLARAFERASSRALMASDSLPSALYAAPCQ